MFCSFALIDFDILQLSIQEKETVAYWSRDILNFDFWKESGNNVSPPHFVHDFLRKIFLTIYELTKFHCVISFPSWDIRQYIPIVCFSGCYIAIFEIGLIFLIKPFVYRTKNSRQNLTKRAFKVKKAFFIIFKGLSVVKNCPRPKSAPLWRKYITCMLFNQSAFTCSKLTIKTLEPEVKYVQS